MYGFTRTLATTIPARMTTTPTTSARTVPVIAGDRAPSASEQSGWPHSEGQEEDAEGHGERPGRPEERRHQALGHAQDDGGDERAADAAHAAEDRDREHPTDVVAV